MIGAACVLSAPSAETESASRPQTETVSQPEAETVSQPETETASDDPIATVEVEEPSPAVEDPLFDETKPAWTCPIHGDSTFFTCGDHNCTEMEILESILLRMNEFTPCQCHLHHQHSCHDSQNMILKVANLLQSVTNLLNLCGSPQFCPHHQQQVFGQPPHVCAHHPQGFVPPYQGPGVDFDSDELDKALDDYVSTLVTQFEEDIAKETMERQVQEAALEAVEEVEKEEEKPESEEVKESGEAKEEAVEKPGEDKKPHKSHKRSKKQKEEEEKKEEEAAGKGLMDVLNLSR